MTRGNVVPVEIAAPCVIPAKAGIQGCGGRPDARRQRHSREGGNPGTRQTVWIPAFAGMTVGRAGMTAEFTEVNC
ncbi:MAG: hypothetical protein GXX96_32850 [Planctomycetaceae bacterium]|nr:hypothetical protein [Planctomycetaceae bacterium]